jgi:hypothetical protein
MALMSFFERLKIISSCISKPRLARLVGFVIMPPAKNFCKLADIAIPMQFGARDEQVAFELWIKAFE